MRVHHIFYKYAKNEPMFLFCLKTVLYPFQKKITVNTINMEN